MNNTVWRLGDTGFGLVAFKDYKGLIVRTSIVRLNSVLRKYGNVNIQDYVEPDPLTVIRNIRVPNNSLGLVMLAMLAIPRGFVASYSDVAELLGMTPRLIGLFASRNPLPVLVPCHRIVNKDGLVGGYSAWNRDGRGFKVKLLSMENVRVNGFRVNKAHFINSDELRRSFYRIYNYYHSLMNLLNDDPGE